MTWSIGAWWRAGHAYSRAGKLLREGQPAAAAKAFEEVLENFPKDARAQIQRARALSAADHIGEAVRTAKRAAELAPKNHAPMLVLGQIQYDAGRYEEARKAFSAAVRLDPDNRMAKSYLGLALLALGQFDEGIDLLQAHLTYGYEALEARLLVLAEDYLWQHKDRAKALEEQLTVDEGGREEGPASFGLHFASAVRRIILWPWVRIRGMGAMWRLRAEEAFSVREWENAIVALQEAEKAGVDVEYTAAGLGMAYLEARKYQAAVEQFRRLPEEVLKEADLAMTYGAALFDSECYEDAREPLGIAAERFTKDFVPAYFRGMCDVAAGQPKAATRWFEMAVERLNPSLAQKRFEEMVRVRRANNP